MFPGSGLVPIADAACVPLSLFGFRHRASDEAIDYATFQNRNESTLEQIVFNANIGGDLFNLFREFGIVQRWLRIPAVKKAFSTLTNSPMKAAALMRRLPIFAGSFEVNEVFGEIFVPLITPVERLLHQTASMFFGRGRYVDNSIAGGFFAWSAGGAIGFIPDITFPRETSPARSVHRRSASCSRRRRSVVTSSATSATRVTGTQARVPRNPQPELRSVPARIPRRHPAGSPRTRRFRSFRAVNPDLNNEEADSYTFWCSGPAALGPEPGKSRSITSISRSASRS